MHSLIFDIETIPDIALGQMLLGIDELEDADTAKAMMFRQQQRTQSEFLPLYQHRVVAISVALRTGDQFKLWSLGEPDSSEAELIERFFLGLEQYEPDLVSWNGGGFDLPVLHYRSLRHGVACPIYWEQGDDRREFRYNNYLSRFHWRHLDLMDVLSGFQPRARAPLDEVATMLGFPGKQGLKGDQVWSTWLAGGIREIRDYCESDVLNTYLVYLKFQHLRGLLDNSQLADELQRVRDWLSASDANHHQQFLRAWAPTS